MYVTLATQISFRHGPATSWSLQAWALVSFSDSLKVVLRSQEKREPESDRRTDCRYSSPTGSCCFACALRSGLFDGFVGRAQNKSVILDQSVFGIHSFKPLMFQLHTLCVYRVFSYDKHQCTSRCWCSPTSLTHNFILSLR